MLPMWASSVSTTSRVPGATRILGGSFGSKKRWHWSRRSLGVVWVSVVVAISVLSPRCSGERPPVLGAENRVKRAGRGGVQLVPIAVPTHGLRDLERRITNCRPALVGFVELSDRG